MTHSSPARRYSDRKRRGTVASVEPDNQWWTALNLGSPEAIIKLFVMKSGCFGLVDRGKGLQSRNLERALADSGERSEEHTSELQSLMRISYAVFCLKKKTKIKTDK